LIDAVAEFDLKPFYASYGADGHGRRPRSADDGDPVRLRLRGRRAFITRDRAPLPRGRRLPGDLRQPGPRSRHGRPLRVRHEEALAGLFGQVLGLCGKAGILDVGVIAVDGTKLAAAASDGAIRTYEQIAAEILAEAGRIDAAEDEIHGEARGDELPEGLRTPNGRRAWLREAKEELERERAENPEPVRHDRAERLGTCRRRLAEDWRAERRANQRYEAYRARGVMKDGRPFGSPPKPYSPPEAPEGKLNATEPDAKRMKLGRNFIPAYNAQAVTTEDQVILAAEITTKGGDFEERRALCQAPVHRRARLCPDQGQSADPPLQTKRPGGGSLGMAPDRGHPQPAEAPPTHLGGRAGLSRRRKPPPRSPRPRLAAGLGAFARQPRVEPGRLFVLVLRDVVRAHGA